MSEADAGAVNSILFISSAVGSPVFGFLIDRIGANLTWVTTGVALTGVCHILFTFTPITPIFTMIVFGISYSILASSLWPLVGIILPQHQRATAYGLIGAFQNLGLGVVGLLTGFIIDTRVSGPPPVPNAILITLITLITRCRATSC